MKLRGLHLGASIYAFIAMNNLINEPEIKSVIMGLFIGMFGVLNMLFVLSGRSE